MREIHEKQVQILVPAVDHPVAKEPADSTLVERTLDRHVALFGAPPRQFTCDGGFSSRSNLEYAKDLGVRDVCFTKSPGLEVDEMVSKPWIYRQLQKFRAGMESCIAF